MKMVFYFLMEDIKEDFIFEEDLPLTSVGKVDYKKVEKMRIKKLEESTK